LQPNLTKVSKIIAFKLLTLHDRQLKLLTLHSTYTPQLNDGVDFHGQQMALNKAGEKKLERKKKRQEGIQQAQEQAEGAQTVADNYAIYDDVKKMQDELHLKYAPSRGIQETRPWFMHKTKR
jgi:hypothetical protein